MPSSVARGCGRPGADVGAVLAPGALGPLPPASSGQIGHFVPGRGLGALVPGRAERASGGAGFVPVLQRLGTARPALLVGLVNPEVIARHQTQALAGEGSIRRTILGFLPTSRERQPEVQVKALVEAGRRVEKQRVLRKKNDINARGNRINKFNNLIDISIYVIIRI